MSDHSSTRTPGYIFLCSDVTEEECLKRNLFGGKDSYAKKVRGLAVGDRLYLYNYTQKRLYGCFVAKSAPGTNLVKTAWQKSGGFPLQVRVTRVNNHRSLSREDIQYHPTLHGRIKFNGIGYPSARLTPETADELDALFASHERVVQYDNGARYRTDDGHLVRSDAERQIDNWLFAHDILHIYEPPLPEAKRADFGIPLYTKRDTRTDDMLYIEYWGRRDRDYRRNQSYKQKLYKQHKLQLVELEPADLKNLDKLLTKKVLRKLDR